MEFGELLKKRRSWRSYEKKSIPREMITELMVATQYAPVSCNLQLTQYVVLDDEQLLNDLTKKVSYKFGYAPTCIVVLFDPRFTVEHNSAVMTAGMAVENLLLRATELGLVACPMAGFRGDSYIKEKLNIPKHLELLLIIPIGFPKGPPPRPVTKLELDAIYRFNSYEGLTSLNGSISVRDYSIPDLIEYRNRITPVYLERFRLQTYKEEYYEKAFEVLSQIVALKAETDVLDLISHDGIFAKVLSEKTQAKVTASDYLEFSRSFFKDSLNIEVVEIDKENAIHTTKEFDVETFIFQIDAVPAVDRLIKSALSYLKKDGVLFIAAINESVLRRCAKMFMGAWKRLNNSKINVYEGNPSYRAGPRTHVSFAILQKKLIAAHHMDIESRRIQLDRGKYMDVMVIRPKLVR